MVDNETTEIFQLTKSRVSVSYILKLRDLWNSSQMSGCSVRGKKGVIHLLLLSILNKSRGASYVTQLKKI